MLRSEKLPSARELFDTDLLTSSVAYRENVRALGREEVNCKLNRTILSILDKVVIDKLHRISFFREGTAPVLR